MSGVLGATASFVAKLALAPESPIPSAVDSYCRNSLMLQLGGPENHLLWMCPAITLVTRGVCLLCMVLLNALMLSSFLDGMNESGSVVGTALSTAANFSSSAFYGIIFFHEYVPVSWYLGASLIAGGMYILSSVELITSS